MMREYHVRCCERFGVKFPLPTRQFTLKIIHYMSKIESCMLDLIFSQKKRRSNNYIDRKENYYLLPFKAGNKYGFCDDELNFIIGPEYDHVTPFKNGVSIFKDNSKYSLTGYYGVIDESGNIILKSKEGEIKLIDNHIIERELYYQKEYAIRKSNHYEYYDLKGNVLIERGCAKIYGASEGLIGVKILDYFNGYKAGFCYLDSNFKIKIELQNRRYKYISNFKDGVAKISGEYGYGYIDIHGEEIIPCKYAISDFNYDVAGYLSGNKFGFFNKKGELLFEEKCDTSLLGRNDSFGETLNNITWFIRKGKYGIIDKNGRILINPIFRKIIITKNELIIATNIDYKCGVIDKLGNVIIPFVYEYIYGYSDGLFLVANNAKSDSCFFVDIQNRKYFNNVFQTGTSLFENGISIYKKNDLYGVIDINGVEVIPSNFDEIRILSNDIIISKKRGFYHIYNNVGDEVSQQTFRRIDGVINGFIYLSYRSIYNGIIEYDDMCYCTSNGRLLASK